MKRKVKTLLAINLIIVLIITIGIIMIGRRMETSLLLLGLDYKNENLLSSINSDITYEERDGDNLSIYNIHEYNKIKHMKIERDGDLQELYEFNGRVFLYEKDKDSYKEYNFENEEENTENFRDALNSLDYVYNFCNELTFENYVKTLKEKKSRLRLRLNRYRTDIDSGYMFDGSQNIELYTDYFGRILNGIYYRDPVGKWTKFLIGDEVKKVKLPKKLESIRVEVNEYGEY